MKRAAFLIAGAFWLMFALGFGVLLLEYAATGVGLPLFGFVMSDLSIGIGLVHVTGLCVAVLICFAMGTGLLALGVGARDGSTAGEPGG